MLKLVTFDLDNTLYDYDNCNQYAEDALFLMMGNLFSISYDESRELLKNAKRKVKSNLGNVAATHNRLLYMQTMCELIDKNPLLYGIQLYECYWNTFLSYIKLFDYVVPLFEQLKKNDINIGLLTDLTAFIQYRKLKKLQIEEYIDFIVTSEEVGEEKPSDKMFRMILNKAGVDASEMIMIGDDENKDIVGAEALGIKTILYKNGANIAERVKEIYEDDSCCTLL